MPSRLRGTCGTCEEITDWVQAAVRSAFGTKLLAECTECGNRITQ